jgi:hypothetical protein
MPTGLDLRVDVTDSYLFVSGHATRADAQAKGTITDDD